MTDRYYPNPPPTGFTLSYTIDDDGVWVNCARCPWREHAGHHPTIDAVCFVASGHTCPIDIARTALWSSVVTTTTGSASVDFDKMERIRGVIERATQQIREIVPDHKG